MSLITVYVKSRGWPFIITWCHRIAGLLLVLFVWVHIYSLTSLYSPAAYDAKMRIFRLFIFGLLEWALAFPVIFHALNGTRLILFEHFGSRNDESMIRWTLGLGAIYVAFLGLIMVVGNQKVSAFFFWVAMFVSGLIVGYVIASRIRRQGHSLFWKAQRVSGGFLLVMVPAHLLFMHLSPSIGKEADVVIMRMQSHVIKVVDLSLLLGALYHGGYGLYSIARDYLSSQILRAGTAVVACTVMLVFAALAVKFTVGIS